MITFAQWVNPEHTTLEVCIDGRTTYIVVSTEGEYQGDREFTEQVRSWIEAGGQPRPFNNGGV